jgi:hypothetical protein
MHLPCIPIYRILCRLSVEENKLLFRINQHTLPRNSKYRRSVSQFVIPVANIYRVKLLMECIKEIGTIKFVLDQGLRVYNSDVWEAGGLFGQGFGISDVVGIWICIPEVSERDIEHLEVRMWDRVGNGMYVPFKREVVGKYEGGLSLILVN